MIPVKGQHDGSRFAHDSLPLDHAEITGIETVVAIVAHHEVMALGHLNRAESSLGRNTRYGHHGMWVGG